jgi:hypothetical protein
MIVGVHGEDHQVMGDRLKTTNVLLEPFSVSVQGREEELSKRGVAPACTPPPLPGFNLTSFRRSDYSVEGGEGI